MSQHDITITFNYNNGTPQWTVTPDPLNVPHGNGKKVVWNLNGATFPDTGGIVFKPGSNWPGTVPAKQNDKKYSSDEDNRQQGSYPYTITVNYNGSTYSHDPDVNNDPPPGDEDGDDQGGSDQGQQGGGGHDGNKENKDA